MKHTVGMTGEVTLQGRVLPIGGLKQKVLAAHAAGLTDAILPERNRGDLDDVPEDVREQMTFHPVMSIDEVLGLALEPARTEAVACDAPHRRPVPPLPGAAGGGARADRPLGGTGDHLPVPAAGRARRRDPRHDTTAADAAGRRDDRHLVTTGVLGVGQTWLSNLVGQRVMHDLRAQVYRHLQRLSLAFFTRTRTGEIQSRIANDIGGVQNVVTSTATSIVSNVTTVIATVIAMMSCSTGGWRSSRSA